VIDHNPGYFSPRKVVGSGLTEKMHMLFGHEAAASSSLLPYHLQVELTEGTKESWIELAFEDYMYGEEDDCG